MARGFRVELTSRAQHDIKSIHALIARDKPGVAAKWAREIDRQIRSLGLMPERYEVIPEAEALKKQYRHIVCHNYRVIYWVGQNRVDIIRVIHAARLTTESVLPSD